jgi:hypothetical protein
MSGHAQPGTPASDGVAGRHHPAIFTRISTAALNPAVTAFLVAIGPRNQAMAGKFAPKERSL